MSDAPARHRCRQPRFAKKGGGFGEAIEECYEDELGQLYVSNDEYGSFVNYCPFCGKQAMRAIPLREHFVIEFRSGSYFQHLGSETGGALESAATFETKETAEEIIRQHWWIGFNGGMVVPGHLARESS